MKQLIKDFDNVKNIHNAIELIDNDQSEERENIEELYDDLITAAEKILNAGTSIMKIVLLWKLQRMHQIVK